jgi:hypothetical protein
MSIFLNFIKFLPTSKYHTHTYIYIYIYIKNTLEIFISQEAISCPTNTISQIKLASKLGLRIEK